MDRGYRPRSPDRGYGPPPDTDRYVPSGGRRPRSRSPPRYRARSRSPPRGPPAIDRYTSSSRRLEGPVDSYPPRPRSPRRDYYDDRAPARERSPPGFKRGRDPSPRGGYRGTPPMKRERRDGGRSRSPPPRASYRPRSRSPPPPRRDDHLAASTYRRRSPEGRSGGGSGMSSRRSSPRPHPRDSYPQDPYRAPSGSYPSPRPRSPPRRETYREEDPYNARASRPPPETLDHRDRPTPTGPSASYREPGPPSGPSAPVSMSAHNRPSSTQPPRGGFAPYRGRGGYPSSRDFPVRDFSGPPPRGGYRGRGRGDYDSSYGPPRRDSFGGPRGSATSLTTPRTQRFNTHLADVPKIKDGGEKLPALYDSSKADKLEEEAAKIRKMIDEREVKKRQGLREWEGLERESGTAALRSELAEQHLKTLNGEGEASGAAAF